MPFLKPKTLISYPDVYTYSLLKSEQIWVRDLFVGREHYKQNFIIGFEIQVDINIQLAKSYFAR